MARVVTNLRVDANADFTQKWRYLTLNATTGNNDPFPLTGYTGVCSIKERPGQSVYTLVTSLPITLGATDGTITLQVSAVLSAAWKWTRGYYYLFLTHPTLDDIRFAEGWVEVNP